MLLDGIELMGASSAVNFTVASGTALPTVGNNTGELFFLTTPTPALHVFTGTDWGVVGAGGGITSADIITALGYTPAALDGTSKLLTSQLPAVAITDTFVVGSQAAMLALTAEVGDVAVRTDLSKTFILRAEGAGTLGNWQELATTSTPATTPAGSTGQVQYNNAGIFAGSGGLTFNGSTTLTLGTTSGGGFLIGAGSQSTANADAPDVTVRGGTATLFFSSDNKGGAGGDLILQGGGSADSAFAATPVNGGDVIIRGGAAGGSANNGIANSGTVKIQTGVGGAIEDRLMITPQGGLAFGGTGATASGYGQVGWVLTSNGNAPPTWQQTSSGQSVSTNTVNTFTKAQVIAPVALSISAGSVAIDATLSNNFRLSLTENATLANPTGLIDGQTINVLLVQDATGGRTLAYGTMYRFAGGDTPAVGSGPNSVNMLSCYYDSTLNALICALARGFA
jgi:hypothetical protein